MLHLGSWRLQQRHLVLAAAISPAETLQVSPPLTRQDRGPSRLPENANSSLPEHTRLLTSGEKHSFSLHFLWGLPLLHHLGLGRHIGFPGMTNEGYKFGGLRQQKFVV